jgi:hypothetical protein
VTENKKLPGRSVIFGSCVFLACCLTFAEDSQKTPVPQDGEQLTCSTGKYTLIMNVWIDSEAGRMGDFWIKDNKTGKQKKVLEFDRDASAKWSPKGDRFYINNFYGSTNATCILFSLDALTRPVDLEKQLRQMEKKKPGAAPFVNYGHVYIAGVKWVSDDDLRVDATGIDNDNRRDFEFHMNYVWGKGITDIKEIAEASRRPEFKEYSAESLCPSHPDETTFREGCSLECAVGWNVKASSVHPSKNGDYGVHKLDDGDCGTAWITGTQNDGIGDELTYTFPRAKWNIDSRNVPLRGFRIINGYIKEPGLWKAYGRVKRLVIYINDEPVGGIELLDSTDIQEVEFGPYGIMDQDIVTLQISKSYPGSKHKQVAITELVPEGAH